MRRRILSLTAALAMVSGALTLASPAASAQTGYQGLCTPTTSSANAGGSHNVGTTFTIQLAPPCVWTPGAPVTVTVNGVSIPGKVASASGVVTVTITVVSATQLSVDDPVAVASQCGNNTVVGTASSSVAGATVTHSVGFTVNCPAATAGATTGNVAFTGANIAKWSAAALVLLAAGFGLLLFSRQRRSRDTVTPA